ncbi:acetyltransferase (GNAT) family protein [Haloactinopolyspora alba]|uniref:Acetyltransferase (GNAT) family protein n=1 Tax=Haloactinopolyspora alba TaxID=648780 RepID=A0A2P8DPK0_9ACTN|nr:GNAT family N-acetyltransferase [Haloactinopolyspora alba]PSK99124.1 acetyltransferase (GNAT) family protein [Haloactinopolyspora alba]
MRIRTVDITADADFGAWFGAHDAALRHDFPDGPGWREHEARVFYEPSTVFDTLLLLAEDDAGDVVGTAAMELPLKDNLSMAQIVVAVPAPARRQGIGTAVLEAAEREAAQRSRTRLMADIDVPSGLQGSSGTRFAERHGYTRRIVEILRAQRPPFDPDHLDELERNALPHAAGYRVVTWQGAVPDEYVAEFARLNERMSTDAPTGELDYEKEAWDERRIRVREERITRMRRGVWAAVAVAPDGTLAGQTELQLSHDDDSAAYQEETIVDPRHRGHRLGLLLKIANLRELLRLRPGVQKIWTWNADTNSHMVAVNEALGYTVAGWMGGYQRDL